MCNTLKVPITIVSDADITYCEICMMGQSRGIKFHMQRGGELIEQEEAFMDVMQRIIFPARFEDAMPSKCKVICMWYEGTKRAPTYVTFNGEEYPQVQLDSSFFS